MWMKLTPFFFNVNRIANRLGTKANFAAKLHTNRQRQTGIRNSQVCEIVTSILYKETNFYERNQLPL